MKYTQLGSSDLKVSRICMGCMGFGDASNGQHSWTVDEEHSREIIRRGLELGVNFFDTAIGYQSGTSEQYLGRALRDFAAAQKGQCKIGIGRRVPLGELAASRQTARTACRSLTARDVHYALFDDLTWELVLADLQPDTRTALLHKTLDALEEADRALLRVYFEQDLSLQKTCAALFLHKNTLQYRLNRIEKRCGLNPRAFRDGALLYLALQAEAAAR